MSYFQFEQARRYLWSICMVVEPLWTGCDTGLWACSLSADVCMHSIVARLQSVIKNFAGDAQERHAAFVDPGLNSDHSDIEAPSLCSRRDLTRTP